MAYNVALQSNARAGNLERYVLGSSEKRDHRIRAFGTCDGGDSWSIGVKWLPLEACDDKVDPDPTGNNGVARLCQGTMDNILKYGMDITFSTLARGTDTT